MIEFEHLSIDVVDMANDALDAWQDAQVRASKKR
jgi:hypothetical protein